MTRPLIVAMAALTLVSCRAYDLESRLTDQGGLLPADKFARYGVEQAQQVAIGRELAHAHQGSSLEDLEQQGETAVTYARSLPDVTDIQADPLGYRVTIRFRSGWLTMVTPIDDGKRGAETSGLPSAAGQTGAR